MKVLLLSLLLIATTICAIPSAFGQTKDTLTNEYLDERDDGLFYQEQSETPFTGVVLLDHYYPAEIEYVKGEKVRNCIYYKNGQKKSEENYVNGEQEGVQTSWYETGQKQSEFHYKNGEQEGLQTRWYNYLEASVNDTEEAGEYMEFYDDASEATEESTDVIEDAPLGAMEAGVETSQASRPKDKSNEAVKEWLEKQQKESEKNYVNGQQEGLQMTWHRNGQKESEYNYANGKRKGLQTEWYENGQKKSKVNYINGKPDGEQAKWYENGQKESEGNYLNAQPEGKHVKWYEDGKKKYEANYLNGKKDGLQKTWYENGQMASETNYKDENKEGLWTEWYENGKTKVKSNYRNDIRKGTQTDWDINGERINKENVSRPNKASSKNDDTAYAAHFFSLDDSKSKFKILAAKDNFFSYTIDGKPHDSAQEPLIELTVGPYYLANKVLDEGELQVWVTTVFNMVFGTEDLDIIYESDLGANGYASYAVLKKRSNDETYLYFQSIVHKGNEVQIMVSQEGGVFDAEEIRKLIRTIKMK